MSDPTTTPAQPTPEQPVAAPTRTGPTRTGPTAGDVVRRTLCVVMGLFWLVIGLALLFSAVHSWTGLIAVCYGLYLIIPGRSKWIVY